MLVPRPYSDEEARLLALAEHALLGAPPDPTLAHIAELAARLFNAPAAFIALVDRERQVFHAKVGLDLCDTDRDIAFCARTIAGDDLLVVLDTARDPRFRDNPLVTGPPFVRFYAGAPLRTADGYAIGTLCIAGSEPRPAFGENDRRLLADLARLACDRLALRRAEEQLYRLAHHDALTGLLNRTALNDRLASALAGGEAVTVLTLDLTGFKDINDDHGHVVGDAVLQMTAEHLQAHAGPDGAVARLDGDEFAIVLPGSHNPLAALARAEAIVQTISRPVLIEGLTLRLSANVGVAPGLGRSAEVADILARADAALHRAKADGRGRCRLFTPDLRETVQRERRCREGLQRAVERDEFELHYQPQVRLSDGGLVGAEALIRWRHPDLGLLAPAAFLPTLEVGPYAAEVGDWVLTAACRQAKAWRHLGMPDFSIGVNLFGAQLARGDLVATVARILSETGLPPGNLELEITENIILHHDDTLVGALLDLRAMGVGIAFDDYGTGYASLSLLKRFPLTRLKIDRSFVQTLCEDHRDAAVVRAIIALGRSFGLEVIAEGIEIEEQNQRLLAKGCQKGQGYLFGKPMPAAALSELAHGGELISDGSLLKRVTLQGRRTCSP